MENLPRAPGVPAAIARSLGGTHLLGGRGEGGEDGNLVGMGDGAGGKQKAKKWGSKKE